MIKGACTVFTPRTPLLAALIAGGTCLSGATARAQQILDIESTTLTTYLPTGASPANDLRPRFFQRGVHIDGSPQAPIIQALAIAGNPAEPGVGGSSRIGDLWLPGGH